MTAPNSCPIMSRARICAFGAASFAPRIRFPCNAAPPPSRAGDVVRRLLPAVVLIVGLGLPGEASASSISPPVAFDADDHAQHCRCRNCRQESCCCGSRKPRAQGGRTAPTRRGEGPCIGAAPCGDAGLPDVPVPGPSGKAASLATGGHRPRLAAVRHVLPGDRCILPCRRASRLDEPPERPLLA